MGGQKTGSHGSSASSTRKQPHSRMQAEFDLLNRALLGQLVQPPETAVAVPLQQAISKLQAGGTGGLVGQLTAGQGQNPQTWGTQTREQLGLPARKSYFPGVPTYEEVKALGVFPGIRPAGGTKKAAEEAGGLSKNKKTRRKQQHPELYD